MKKFMLILAMLIPLSLQAQMEINAKYGFGHFVYDPTDEDVEMNIGSCGKPLIDRNLPVTASIECNTYSDRIPWEDTFPGQTVVNFNSNNAPGIKCTGVFVASTRDDVAQVFLQSDKFNARYEAVARPDFGYDINVRNTCFNLRPPLLVQ